MFEEETTFRAINFDTMPVGIPLENLRNLSCRFNCAAFLQCALRNSLLAGLFLSTRDFPIETDRRPKVIEIFNNFW